MTTWFRRHPILTALLGAVFVLLTVSALFGEDPVGAVFAAVVFTFVLGTILWVMTAIVDRVQGRGRDIVPDDVSSEPAPPVVWPPIVPTEPIRAARVSTTIAAPPSPSPPTTESRFLTVADLTALAPTAFADLTQEMLHALGYTDVRGTGATKDLAADLSARDRQGRSSLIQCRWLEPGSRLEPADLQSMIESLAATDQNARGMLVTNGDVTTAASDLARQHDITLIDRNSLLLLLHLTGITPKAAAPAVQPALPPPLPPPVDAPPVPTPPPKSSRIFCRNCGAVNPFNARSCVGCGEALTPPVATGGE